MASKTSRSLRGLLRSDSAATAVEYGLVAALIAIVIAGSLTQIGTKLNDVFNTLAAYL